jgi:hypothetical protein
MPVWSKWITQQSSKLQLEVQVLSQAPGWYCTGSNVQCLKEALG